MISFITPESDFPTFDVKGYASVIAKAYLQFTDARLMEALVARFGSMPPDEEIVAHCMKIIDKDKVTHFV